MSAEDKIMWFAKKKGKKISEEKAIEIVVGYINDCTAKFKPLDLTIVGNTFLDMLMPKPEFRHAMREYYSTVGRHVDACGHPKNYHVLILDQKSPIKSIVRVYHELRDNLETRVCTGGILLLENDGIIKEYKPELKRAGVYFFPDWEDKDSIYRRLVKAAKTYGTIYKMVCKDARWTYQEVQKG